MKKIIAIILPIVFYAVSAGAVHEYQVVDVSGGAAIKGVVKFEGTVPADEMVMNKSDVEYCGKELKRGRYIISNGAVKNVVVWIEGTKKGKAVPKKALNITIKKCQAVPHVDIGFTGGEYVFKNDDDILHTIQSKLELAYQKKVSARPLKNGATIYNIALPKKGLEVRKPVKNWHRYTDETGLVQVRSNTHESIQGYRFIFNHPYAAVTDDKGSFEIDGLLPGEYTLKAWHEGFGIQEQKINVESGKSVEIEIAFAK